MAVRQRAHHTTCSLTDCIGPEVADTHWGRVGYSTIRRLASRLAEPCVGLASAFFPRDAGVSHGHVPQRPHTATRKRLTRRHANRHVRPASDVSGERAVGVGERASGARQLLPVDVTRRRHELVVRLLRRPWTERRMPCIPHFVSGDEIDIVDSQSHGNADANTADDGRWTVLAARSASTNRRLSVWLMRAQRCTLDDVAVQASMLQYVRACGVTPPFVGIGCLAGLGSPQPFLEQCIVTESGDGDALPSDVDDTDVTADVPTDVTTLLRAHAARRYFAGGLRRRFLADWYEICAGVCAAVGRVNAKGVVVNGVSARSVLLCRGARGGWRPLLADFTAARYRHYAVDAAAVAALPACSAPELLRGVCSPATDAFAVGCLLEQIGRHVPLPALRLVAAQCMSAQAHERPDCARIAELVRAAAQSDWPTVTSYKMADSDVIRDGRQ